MELMLERQQPHEQLQSVAPPAYGQRARRFLIACFMVACGLLYRYRPHCLESQDRLSAYPVRPLTIPRPHLTLDARREWPYEIPIWAALDQAPDIDMIRTQLGAVLDTALLWGKAAGTVRRILDGDTQLPTTLMEVAQPPV